MEKTKKIFLVDDQKITNFLNKKLLESCSFSGEVCAFEDPSRAFAELVNHKPTLVLLDINMPEIDGWKFLELMNENSLGNIKVIMVTSSTSPLDKMKAQSYEQVLDYMVKPLTRDMVSGLVERYFS